MQLAEQLSEEEHVEEDPDDLDSLYRWYGYEVRDEEGGEAMPGDRSAGTRNGDLLKENMTASVPTSRSCLTANTEGAEV